MSRKCDICGKKAVVGHNVSYSKRRTRRIFLPNLRWSKLLINGQAKKVKICMKCLKKAKKEGRVSVRERVNENKNKVISQESKVARESSVPRVPQEELKNQETETQKNQETKKLKDQKTPARNASATTLQMLADAGGETPKKRGRPKKVKNL